MVCSSWRSQTERTPKGEIDIPCLASSLEARVWPQAGWSIAIATTAASISGSTRFFRIGLRRDSSCSAKFAAFVVEILEPIEAVPAVAHNFTRLADVAELLGQFEQAALARMIFWSLVR